MRGELFVFGLLVMDFAYFFLLFGPLKDFDSVFLSSGGTQAREELLGANHLVCVCA